jgi:type IV pilus assembly protein PilA
MINRLRVRAQGESGFTLVELLVVMLILGLLAAIAIPAFFNQRTKAQDSEAKSTVKTAQTAIETYATDNNGSYVGATRANLKTIEPTLSSASTGANAITTLTVAASSYTLTVTSESTNTFSIVRATDGSLTYPCSPSSNGGCPSSGSWG